MAEINIWKPDSKDGSEGRNSPLGIIQQQIRRNGNIGWGFTSYLGKTGKRMN